MLLNPLVPVVLCLPIGNFQPPFTPSKDVFSKIPLQCSSTLYNELTWKISCFKTPSGLDCTLSANQKPFLPPYWMNFQKFLLCAYPCYSLVWNFFDLDPDVYAVRCPLGRYFHFLWPTQGMNLKKVFLIPHLCHVRYLCASLHVSRIIRFVV